MVPASELLKVNGKHSSIAFYFYSPFVVVVTYTLQDLRQRGKVVNVEYETTTFDVGIVGEVN